MCDHSEWLVGRLQVVCHCERKPHHDVQRFEKISNIIKQFKLSCSKVTASFQSMEVSNSMFAAYIESFTQNSFIMVIMSDREICKRLLFSYHYNSSLSSVGMKSRNGNMKRPK